MNGDGKTKVLYKDNVNTTMYIDNVQNEALKDQEDLRDLKNRNDLKGRVKARPEGPVILKRRSIMMTKHLHRI